MVGIAAELADAFGQLLRRHVVFVLHPPERFLIQLEALTTQSLGIFGIELTFDKPPLRSPSPCSYFQ
jgi:hypothetical protein